MENKTPLEKYKDDVGTSTKEQSIQEVILFFSFDIVNSSQYKTINYYGWARTLVGLFDELNKRVKKAIEDSELWRILGDEAIFIVRIKKIDEIYDFISLVYKILRETINDIKKGIFFQGGENFSDKEIELMKLQNILSLKASAWIAAVSENTGKDEKVKNIFQIYNLDSKGRFYEFLGNDIDTGFRISKFTSDGRLVVSVELAYLLSKRTDYMEGLYIITYKHLKGVWNEKYYPIIWFHDSKMHEGASLEETFEFDEEDVNPLVKEYYENRSQKHETFLREKEMFTNTVKALRRIIQDRNLKDKVEEIETIIEKTDEGQHDYIKSPTLELHCVAVCYSQKENSILIAKRSDMRENFPGYWEFGCAKANKDIPLSDGIVSEYKEDFGIDIELIKDECRADKQPIPLAVYQIEKNKDLHKGVIFIAKIKGEVDVQNFKPTKKHSCIKWIKQSDIDNFTEDAVEDFKETLKNAYQKLTVLGERDGK